MESMSNNSRQFSGFEELDLRASGQATWMYEENVFSPFGFLLGPLRL